MLAEPLRRFPVPTGTGIVPDCRDRNPTGLHGPSQRLPYDVPNVRFRDRALPFPNFGNLPINLADVTL